MLLLTNNICHFLSRESVAAILYLGFISISYSYTRKSHSLFSGKNPESACDSGII